MDTIKCVDCEQEIKESIDGGTGYAIGSDNQKVCYKCCAVRDEHQMLTTGKITLYLSTKGGHYVVTNWPGTLRIENVSAPRRSYHNMARYRYDVWFRFKGQSWHGVQYGDNTQVLHCARRKGD